MSQHFLLDGYNIVKQTSPFCDLAVDVARERFIRAIEKYQPQGSRRNPVTVIFDGRPGNVDPILSVSVKVLFSYDESADDRIKDLVKSSDNPRNIVVVTDDREIQYHVKGLGASVWPVKAFLDKMGGGQARQGQKDTKPLVARDSPKVLSKTQEFKINQELEKIWIEKRKNR